MQLDKNKISVKERRQDILKTGGIHIGGDDFDAQIMWNKLTPYFGYGLQYDSYGKMLDLPVHIFRTICEWEQMAFLKEGKIRKQLDNYYQYTNKNPALRRLMSLIDNNLGFSLFRTIEKAKINLSGNKISGLEFNEAEIEMQETLSIQEFNDFIDPEIAKIDEFLTRFLQEANMESAKIDHVFITGGTSSSKAVMDIFNRKFSESKIHRGDNFNSVAQGLAYSYFYLSKG
jgi:hypothetical chaperone protein